MDLPTLQVKLQNLGIHYQKAKGQEELLQQQQAKLETQLADLLSKNTMYELEQVLLQKTSEFARAQIKSHIEDIVTNALQVVFQQDLGFQILFDIKAGNPTAEFQVVSKTADGILAVPPEDARGGGVVDVVSLALRLAVLQLIRPVIEGPLILDEPGKHVSEEYIQNLGYFLKEFSQKTGRQIIMITHNGHLAEIADKSFRVSQRNGISEVVET